MKRLLVCAGVLAVAATVFAQHKPAASPSEIVTATVGSANVTIKYSSPRVKGREGHIFTKDGLIGHDHTYPVWRAGANAATTLETSAEIQIGDLDVPAGTYTLFVNIADPDHWDLIVSKATGEWGLSYDASKDLGKTKMHMSKPASMVEDLKYTITGEGSGKGKLTLAWENKEASVSIKSK